MLAFWNSLNTVSTLSTVVEVSVLLLGLVLFVVERRETALELEAEDRKDKRFRRVETFAKVLQRERKPRKLCRSEREALLNTLRQGPTGPVHLNFLSGNHESENYAKQFQSVFKEAGFEVEQFSWFVGGTADQEFSVDC